MAMMFEYRNGPCRPRLVCDVCQQPITDASAAMAVHGVPPGEPEAELTEALHAHKASPCQDVARRRCGHENDFGPWEEVGAHLVRLAVGVGIDPDAFRERLGPEELRLVEMRHEGREWSGTAAELGGTPEAVRKRLSRALDRVARELGLDEGIDE